jgi:D-arabinose 1-dehydrogenase-like Zn-dependent alcohol dehydrogenase
MFDVYEQRRVACEIGIIPIQNIDEAWQLLVEQGFLYRFLIDRASLRQNRRP